MKKPDEALAQNNGWQLVWHDEFETDGRPDSTKWTYERGFERNEELQWYAPENVFQSDGHLVIEARPADLPCPSYKEGSTHWRNNRPRILWTSGSVKTRGLYSFQYGRVEVCARIPVCLGAWPAIWLLGNSGGWPACGEIDMMEYYQYQGCPTVMGLLLYPSHSLHQTRFCLGRTLPCLAHGLGRECHPPFSR